MTKLSIEFEVLRNSILYDDYGGTQIGTPTLEWMADFKKLIEKVKTLEYELEEY